MGMGLMLVGYRIDTQIDQKQKCDDAHKIAADKAE
jgi:hypothetical protein